MQDWTFQQTISPAETFAVQYRIKEGSPPAFVTKTDEVSFPAVSEVYTEYATITWFDKDGKKQTQDVTKGTISTTTTP